MDISIMDCKVYIISPGDGKYRTRLLTCLRRLIDMGFHHVEFIKSIPDDSNTNSLTRTVMSIMERELREIKPFLIVEDDVQVYHIQRTIHLPSDTHMLYLGVAWWLYPFSPKTLHDPNRQRKFQIGPMRKDLVSSFDDHLCVVKGMMSAHAVLFISRSFIRSFIQNMKDLVHMSVPHDLLLASMQNEWKTLALKQPLFYQDATMGGQEGVTKLWWDDSSSMYSRQLK